MLDCLQLVHCHPGSQLQDIRRVKDAINELAHVYAELKLFGAGLQYIDVGGGLGVDYDGSGTNFSSSMNYTLNEYANDVVYRIANVCNTRKIAHPMIVSESGRAIAAHHSVLIFNTLGTLGARPVPRHGQGRPAARRASCRSRCATCSTRFARSPSGAWSSVITTRRPRATRCCRCSTSGCCRSSSAAWPSGCTGRPAPRCATSRASSTKSRRSSKSSSPSSRTSTSAISRCSSRCPTAGPSTSCSRSCPSTGSTSGRRARACWPTSPATPTARSTAS